MFIFAKKSKLRATYSYRLMIKGHFKDCCKDSLFDTQIGKENNSAAKIIMLLIRDHEAAITNNFEENPHRRFC